MSRELPERVHLPSGRVVRLDDARARAVVQRGRGQENPLRLALAVLEAPGVLRVEGAAERARSLPLRDASVLRALLAWAAILPEPAEEFECENCQARFELAPSTALELGPFLHGELDDPELDAPFDFAAAHPIRPIRVGGAIARRARLADRDVGGALPLWEAPRDRELRVTPAVVAALGLVALGKERRASVLADALASASPEAWSSVVELFERAHYPERLVALWRCETCGARNDVLAPLARELEMGGAPHRRRRAPGPDLDAFEAEVRRAAEKIFRARGVRNVDLFIDDGVPACDEGGEPLLGCYTPGEVDPAFGPPRPPEVRIFYRTFQAELSADPTFDVAAEVAETIDHELEHHLHHLAGHDPLDAEERSAIAREELRRIGPSELSRRARRGLSDELVGFVRTAWPLLLLLVVGALLTFC